MNWQRSYLVTMALLGEREIEGTYTESPDAQGFVRELASATTREARARMLAREATGILVDVGGLAFSLDGR